MELRESSSWQEVVAIHKELFRQYRQEKWQYLEVIVDMGNSIPSVIKIAEGPCEGIPRWFMLPNQIVHSYKYLGFCGLHPKIGIKIKENIPVQHEVSRDAQVEAMLNNALQRLEAVIDSQGGIYSLSQSATDFARNTLRPVWKNLLTNDPDYWKKDKHYVLGNSVRAAIRCIDKLKPASYLIDRDILNAVLRELHGEALISQLQFGTREPKAEWCDY